MNELVSESAALLICTIKNEVYMIVHKDECRYGNVAFQEPLCNYIHACYECLFVLKKNICTESVREQVIEPTLSHNISDLTLSFSSISLSLTYMRIRI